MNPYIVAAAHRFLHRKNRSLKEREAYFEGLFDAGMTNQQQKAVELVLFPKKQTSSMGKLLSMAAKQMP